MERKLPYTTRKGEKISGYNKPVNSKDGKHKKVVLAKVGEKVKLLRFGYKGMSDFTKHKDPKRRASYLVRSGGIRDGKGNLTKDNKLKKNYWARKVLR